jgi:anhydro-N-acetylmuramic acid kinase
LKVPAYYIGIMSGTSLDGVDAVLASFHDGKPHLLCSTYQPYDDSLRAQLLALNSPDTDELHRAATVGNELSRRYAAAVAELLEQSGTGPSAVAAIGCHGQTVRHRPDLGYTIQLGNPALLAELTCISVIADFRSRDVAAGGQGAPLVPAFHQAIFASATPKDRAIVNIGGISNITCLPATGPILGFDCGPGNLLMDAWASRNLGTAYDEDGAWAASGHYLPDLLRQFLSHPFFQLPPPKSTGRDDFHLQWLDSQLPPGLDPADVQATLLELTAASISGAVERHCPTAGEVFVCGGGAHNGALLRALARRLPGRHLGLTDELGVHADWVEALAFAWLARQTVKGRPGNLPQVTGARGERILGAIYPA